MKRYFLLTLVLFAAAAVRPDEEPRKSASELMAEWQAELAAAQAEGRAADAAEVADRFRHLVSNARKNLDGVGARLGGRRAPTDEILAGASESFMILENMRAVLKTEGEISPFFPASLAGQCLASQKRAVIALYEAMRRAKPPAQTAIQNALTGLGFWEAAAAVVPAAAQDVLKEDKNLRNAAAAVLRSLGPRARGAAPELAHSLRRGHIEAASVLVAIGTTSVPSLMPLSSADDARVRAASIRSLKNLRAAGAEIAFAEKMIEIMNGDPDPEVRQAAFDSLEAVPSARDVVLPEMRRLIEDPETPADQLRTAAFVIRSLGAEGAPILADNFRAQEPDARQLFINILGQFASNAAAAAPALIEHLKTLPPAAEGSVEAREAVETMNALEKIGCEDCVEAVEDWKKRRDRSLRLSEWGKYVQALAGRRDSRAFPTPHGGLLVMPDRYGRLAAATGGLFLAAGLGLIALGFWRLPRKLKKNPDIAAGRLWAGRVILSALLVLGCVLLVHGLYLQTIYNPSVISFLNSW